MHALRREARAAIDAKAAELVAGGMNLTRALDVPSRTIDAFEVHGPTYVEWVKRSYVTGTLGFPTSDEFARGDGVRVSEFQGGSLHFDPNTQRLGGTSSTGALALVDRGRF